MQYEFENTFDKMIPEQNINKIYNSDFDLTHE